MPIPVKLRVPPPPVVAGPTPPTPVQWGKTYVSITGKNGEGEEIPLTGFSGKAWPGIVMQPGATGLDSPPFELHSDDSPNLDGGIFRNSRAVQREIMVPVHLHGIDRKSLKDLQRKLVSSLNPTKGYCVLKFIESDAVPKYLYCYYKAGMEGSEETSQSGFTWKTFGIQLTAFDPYFYSDFVQAAQWSFGTGEPFLSTTVSFLPFKINAGLLSGSEVTIVNPGDVQAWPVWKLNGPIRSFQFVSPDGKSFGITAPIDGSNVIGGGRTLTVDTRPGYKSLKDDLGVNYWPLLDDDPELWPISEGISECNVSIVPGAGTASVELTYSPRYEGF